MNGFGELERDFRQEALFSKTLATTLRESNLRTKVTGGTRLEFDRLSEKRKIVRVKHDKPHPHADVGRPDLTVYYQGDPLPFVYDRCLSNPFFIECKILESDMMKDVVQGLRYKWRDGATGVGKYVGDSTVFAAPVTLGEFDRSDTNQFRQERFLWHLGIGLLRNDRLIADPCDFEVAVISFNEEEKVVFNV